MDYEVVVIGGGIGGLTAAALLAARGVRVGLFERAAEVGGCVAPVEASGFRFDPGAGLYADWGVGEIHARVFDEIGLTPPTTSRLDPAYAVRLPDGTEVMLAGDPHALEETIARSFPECAAAAISFYREILPIAAALERAVSRVPGLATTGRWQRAKLLAAEPAVGSRIMAAMHHTVAQHLTGVSDRFRRFIDAQLQFFGLCGADECSYLYGAMALTAPVRGLYSIEGAGAALAAALGQAIAKNGGAVHCNQTVLRLVFGPEGRAVGVDLLNGERVTASRAVVSNLTAADTYGKLIGWERTPAEVRRRIKAGAAWGAYQMFLSATPAAIARLSAGRIIALTDWQHDQGFAPQDSLFMCSVGGENSAPPGRRAITVSAFCETEPWFAFQHDGSEAEVLDQAELARWWTLLHGAVPEIGPGLEVIETANPRTYYDNTRRTLGTVGGLGQSLAVFGPQALTHRTPVPGLHLVGDSAFPGNGIAAVTYSGVIAANEICS
jgi:C-3',4' desaturase CrtD